MGHAPGEYVGDRLDAAVRVPREPGQVVSGTLVAEVVEQQERIELSGVPEAERATQVDAGAFHRGHRLCNSFTGRMDMFSSNVV